MRTPRLFEELRIAHGDGSFGKRLSALAKTELLILDDWGLAPLNQAERNDLLEVIDDRVGARATLITSQLPIEHWHAYLNDPTLVNAILDAAGNWRVEGADDAAWLMAQKVKLLCPLLVG